MKNRYTYCKFTDFNNSENNNLFKEALRKVENSLGKEYEPIIDGERIRTNNTFTSVNPSETSQTIGTIHQANKEIADKAVKAATIAYEKWRKVSPAARAALLFRVAEILKERRHEFSAYLVLEAGKSWKEADAETCEAIDFVEYYGRQMLSLKEGKKIFSREFESNQMFYQPMGVTVTISPWNFPLAIMAGTTVAPLVAGNAVVLKPAQPGSVVAAEFMKVLEEAGLPKGTVNFVPGSGSEIGDYLVNHPNVHLITFTGSREVGSNIYSKAAKVQKGQSHLKNVIAELGGKNNIIIAEDANIELASNVVIGSGFGYSGQKCSAGSRILVHEKIYDAVLDNVIQKASNFNYGDPRRYETKMGPVINKSAFNKVIEYIEIGKKESDLAFGGNSDDSKGYFIQPTVFSHADPNSRIMQEEIFGPVVALTKISDFNSAIDIANDTEYGLSAAVITNKIEYMTYAKDNLHVGNLYFNRNSTGTIVGYHPFGGIKMSGTNAKAGGPDYLLLHMNAKTVSEMH